jgi:hypothetical protein
MGMKVPRVVVTIDRLVLRGFRAADRDAIAASLSAELQRRFGDAFVSHEIGASRAVASLAAKAVRVTAGAPSRAVGTNAARNIVRSVCR